MCRYSPAYAIINLEARAGAAHQRRSTEALEGESGGDKPPDTRECDEGIAEIEAKIAQTIKTGKRRRKLYADAMQVYLKAKDFIVQLPEHTKLYRAEKVTPRDLKHRWSGKSIKSHARRSYLAAGGRRLRSEQST